MRRTRWRAVLAGACAALCTASVAGTAVQAATAPTGNVLPVYLNTHYSFAERAADLMSRMTQAERVAQLHTNSAPAIPRLGLQQYTYWSEGQHGLNTLGADTNSGSDSGGVHATSFPTNFASTMTWDPNLVYRETTAISNEARGELDPSLWGTAQNNLGPSASDYGDLTFWAPTVNMDRDPRWGRTDEAFGEDPYLAEAMADAFVDGYEGNTMTGKSLDGYLKVASTGKHFALNNVEDSRHTGSSNTTDANIRDYYTAQFRSLIEDAHVAGIMTSYNAVNGTPSPADTYTANELLQRTYGFNGYTTSDCGAVGDTYSTGSHDWVPPGWTASTNGTWTNTATGQTVPAAAGGQAYSARAGTDLNCTGAEYTLANIQAAIAGGALDEGVIDNALTHVLTTRMQTGEFDPAGKVPYTKITKAAIQSAANQALAREVADEALVLLQNNDVSGTTKPLLPADPATLNKVVIVGDLANAVTLGGYSGEPSHTATAVQGITAAVKAANPGAQVVFDPTSTSTTATTPAVLSAQTQADIKGADLVVVFAGTDENVAGEGNDRADLEIPGNYGSLIDQVHALGNPRTALVLQTDGPVDLSGVQGDFPAILFSGYNGQAQGTALADVLFGKQNPSGHLDFTWYKDASQLPAITNYGLTPAQTDGLGRTYMYFTGTPTYPFGYGLSYTSFRYSDLQVTPGVSADGTVRLSVDVTNTGHTAGSTVAQLYVAPQFTVAGTELPKEQLAGFQKTAVLEPGRTQRLTLSVKASDLSRWDEQSLKEVVNDGAYRFDIGSDASDIALSRTVDVHGAIAPRVQYVTVQPDQVIFSPGQTLNLTGTNPWIAPDTDPTLEQPHASADKIVEAVNNDESFVNLANARVRYWTGNPGVASVSSRGVVTTHAPGVTSIYVSVNGVTGSTPIVVKDPFSITMPAVLARGATGTVTTSVTASGTSPLHNVTMALNVPSGWTATAASPATIATVAPGGTATTTWNVTVPTDTSGGNPGLSATASFTGDGGPYVQDAESPVAVLYPSLTSAFDNAAISDDADPGGANMDGATDNLSAQALAAAGLTPGASITHDGLGFTWPNAQAGQPDNVVAGGQAITVSGSGQTLGFLGLGDYGTAAGTGTITYTDGSTQQFSLTFPDWWSNTAPPGGDILAGLPYINTGSGKENQKVSVYYAGVQLQSGKTVAYVTLPDVSDGAVNGSTAMHIFAVAIG